MFEQLLRRAPLIAALLAAVAALPGLWLPFLADDWGLLADAAQGSLARTPFGYFRPLTALTFRAELQVWGPRPFFFHLTNLLLAAACAALLSIVLRRLTGDAVVAALGAAIFALHPYHVENVWWVAGRADMLACLFLLAAFLAYERWRTTLRGIPLGTLLLFMGALLSKEAAISFPLLILLIEWTRSDRGDWRATRIRGVLPLAGLALLHALVVRRLFLGAEAFANLRGTLPHWIGNFFAFLAGSLVPLHTEYLEGHPFLAGFLALVVAGFAFLWAHRKDRPDARLAATAAIAFLILLGPSLLSFQERYLFIPSAAVATILVVLGRTLPQQVRRLLGAGLSTLWLGSLAWHAIAWTDAARVSTHLIEGLRQTSMESEAGGILVANMPHRVHGVAVAANFRQAVVLSGGRAVPIKAATALDLPSSRQDGLAGGFSGAITRSADDLVVRVEVPAHRFSRVVLPLPGKSVAKDADGEWEVTMEAGKLQVRIPLPARSALRIWTADGLRLLEVP
ncbi:MAG TPA: hypothetical protein VFW45_05180 [Candidatus Polarisedimenticolia bacterium]|nr:hypothetical protein [Candidatus Polarisedimenticolia bacterium]